MTRAGSVRLAAIEAGGTKFALVVGDDRGRIVDRHAVPTRDPVATLSEVASWFEARGTFAAVGIASFGPAEIDPASPRWGHILNTPKPGWAGCDIAGFFADRFGVPIGFDTDVNGAALGEYRLGAGFGKASLAYVTVGTGIGGGLVVGGKPLHGAGHPEMGHLFPRRSRQDHAYPGNCPIHGDCLEGLASGPAILARWHRSLSELPETHEAHALVADYLAQLCHTVFAITAAETIVLGGGVMKAPWLVQRVQERARLLDNGYWPGAARLSISSPVLRDDSGVIGALFLATHALNQGGEEAELTKLPK